MAASVTDRATGFETELRSSFDAIDLLLEVDLHPRQYACARDHVGALMDEIPAGAHIALLMRFPALTITGLVGHAALSKAGDDYWETFWTAIGRERDDAFETVVGQLLGDLLRECGLRDVEALRAKSIAPLMKLHAGPSATAVDTLVSVVEGHVRAGHEPRGTAVLEKITEPGFEHRHASLPAEFRILLKYAPAVAVGIMNRLTELLVATVAYPETWSLDALTPTTTDLPGGILHSAIERLRRAPFLDGDQAIPLCTSTFPELRFDAADGEIRVMVPQSATDTVWRVWTGGAPQQIAVPAGEASVLSIDSIVRETVLINLDTGLRRVVPIFDAIDPLVVFGGDGRRVSRFEPLPAGEVLVLVPHDADIVSGTRKKISVSDSRPAPWRGWELRTVDLAGHAQLTVRRDGRDGRTRRILPVESPGYAIPEPLAGITARSGEPVYGERPLVDLPAHEGEDTKEWRVRVRRVGELDWAIDYPWASVDYVTSADPFDGLAEPLLGRYEIAAGDSYGLDLRLTVVLAEGLEVSHDPIIRLPQSGGLAASVTELVAESGLEFDATELAFSATEIECTTAVRTDDAELDLVICPPHAQLRFEHPGHPAVWQSALPKIGIDEAGPGQLTIRIPGAANVSFALLDTDGDIVREWDADTQSGTEFGLSTKSVTEAAKKLLSGSLIALIEDENGDSEETEIAEVVRSAPIIAPETIDHVGDELTAEWLRLDTVQAEQVDPPVLEAAPMDAAVAPADELLTANPTASLEALGDSPVAPSRIPSLLIRSGLAECIFTTPEYTGAHPNPFISCTLATSAIVDQDGPQRDNVQSFLAARGGEDLLRVIATGQLEDPRTGVFDRNVLAVDSMGRDQVEALFERFSIVPGPLVDVDMRTAATIEAFHRRAEWMTDPVSLEAPRYVNKTLRDVRRASPELYDMIAARNEALHGVDTISNPWMLLSMQSLAFAAIGRLEAYGRFRSPVLTDEARAMWATLADYCPAMVAADLLIANAVVVRADALDKMKAAG